MKEVLLFLVSRGWAVQSYLCLWREWEKPLLAAACKWISAYQQSVYGCFALFLCLSLSRWTCWTFSWVLGRRECWSVFFLFFVSGLSPSASSRLLRRAQKQELRNHLQREGRLTKEDCLDLIKAVTELTSNEPNLLRLNDPVTGIPRRPTHPRTTSFLLVLSFFFFFLSTRRGNLRRQASRPRLYVQVSSHVVLCICLCMYSPVWVCFCTAIALCICEHASLGSG